MKSKFWVVSRQALLMSLVVPLAMMVLSGISGVGRQHETGVPWCWETEAGWLEGSGTTLSCQSQLRPEHWHLGLVVGVSEEKQGRVDCLQEHPS